MRTIHSLKEVLLVSILSLFLGFETQAQPCDAQSSLVVSTGLNPITQTVLPPGTPDPMWTLIQSPPAPAGWPITLGAPAFVIPQYGSWDATPGPSSYINAFNTNSSVANNWGLSTQAYVFERPFCICNPNGSNENIEVTFDLKLHADNWAEVFFVENGTGPAISLLAQPYVYSTANFLNPTDDATVTLSIPPGNHTLQIHQRNKQVRMGVSLWGELTSTGMLSDNLCDPEGSIVGSKYNDIDGNGVVSGADATVPGWTINLYDNSGTLVATTTTDGTGFYSFPNLLPGTYTVTEVPQAGWTMVNPASGSQTITVVANAVNMVNFLNKQGQQSEPCDFKIGVEPVIKECGVTFNSFVTGIPSGYYIVSSTWTFGDGYSSDILSPVHYYTAAGIYTACLEVTIFNGRECCTIKKCFDIRIEKPCDNKCDIEAKIVEQQLNNCTYNLDGLILSTGTAITNWAWDFGDGTTGTGSSVNHTFPGSGSYMVTLTVFGYSPNEKECCFVQVRHEVRVECDGGGKARMTAPNNSDDIINNVILHPNPSNGIVNLSFDLKNDNRVSISIIDVTGKVVYEHTPSYILSGSHSIEISTELPKGIYTSIISTENNKVTKKLIIL